MGAIDKSRVWKITVVLILAAFITIDIIFDKTFTESSNDWAIEAQKDGGDALRYISIFFSSVAAFWIFVFIFFYIVFNKDIIFYLYIMTIFVGSLVVTYILKALYYRERPYAVNGDLHTECSCDPGMPSGHSTTAAGTYIVLFLVVYRHHLIYKPESKRVAYSIALIAFGVMFTIFIMLAMIYTGVHTYSQTIIGAWISITVASLLTFEVWLRLIYKVRKYIRLGSAIFLVSLIIYTIMMLFINSYEREDPEEWIFFEKQCPDCNETWVYGQTRALAVVYFLPVFYFFFPFEDSNVATTPRGYAHRSPSARASGQPYRVSDPETQGMAQGQLQPGAQLVTQIDGPGNAYPAQQPNVPQPSSLDNYEWRPDHRVFSRKQQWLRLMWVAIFFIPAVILAAIYQFWIQDYVLESETLSKQVMAIIVFFEIGIIAIYSGWALTWLKDRVFMRKNLLTYNDRLYWDDLKRRIEVPEVIQRPSRGGGQENHVTY
jgi:membrane-associated phospholipid phosphatase